MNKTLVKEYNILSQLRYFACIHIKHTKYKLNIYTVNKYFEVMF